MRGLVRWVTLVMLLSSVVTVGQVALAPAAPACACGAAPTREGRQVSGETALVTWDGHTQTTDMVMHLGGPSTDAAWIMPAPPGAQLGLGNPAVWSGLRAESRPHYVTRADWTPRFDFFSRGDSSAVAPASTMEARVERVVDVGPFRVTTLSGNAESVNIWLAENGFAGRPDLVPAFQSYLDEGWRIQAVRLSPERQGESFAHGLPPLRMSFAAERIVYPIRLSRHAAGLQSVRLYVVAPHRMAILQEASPREPLRLDRAGWVPAQVAGLDRGLGAGEADGRVFLTSWSGSLAPDGIEADFEMAPTVDDSEYVREIVTQDESPGRLLGFLILMVVPLAIAGLVVVPLVRAARRTKVS